MKRYLIAIAIVIPVTASAQQSAAECTNEAVVFNFAATFRDTGMSPQQALASMRAQPSMLRGFSDDLVKNIVDVVYFDPDASRIPHGQMYSAIVRSCMFPPKTYQPLN